MKTTAMLLMHEENQTGLRLNSFAGGGSYLTARGRGSRTTATDVSSFQASYLTKKAAKSLADGPMPRRVALGKTISIENDRSNSHWAPSRLKIMATPSPFGVQDGHLVDLPDLNLHFADAGLATQETVWANIQSIVDKWAALEADWDDNDAAPLSIDMLRHVRRFVDECEARGIREPRPYIASDGEVGFHWDGAQRAAVSFVAEGRFLAYVDRCGQDPVRVAGPIDLATGSNAMFEALAVIS